MILAVLAQIIQRLEAVNARLTARTATLEVGLYSQLNQTAVQFEDPGKETSRILTNRERKAS
jgi:hypothetical protein